MGLRDVLGISDYQIMIWGALISMPITVFSRWTPSFAKQRVDFTVKLSAEGEAVSDNPSEKQLSFREAFALVKHNRWFLMCTIVRFVQLLVPGTDKMFLYRFLIPKMQIRSKEYGGEMLYTLQQIVFGWPSLVLSPFAVKAVEKLRGPMLPLHLMNPTEISRSVLLLKGDDTGEPERKNVNAMTSVLLSCYMKKDKIRLEMAIYKGLCPFSRIAAPGGKIAPPGTNRPRWTSTP